MIKHPRLKNFLRTEARQLLGLFLSFLVRGRDEAETEKAEASDHSSDDEEAVGDPSLGNKMRDNWEVADLFRISSSTKYFSLQSTSLELLI